MIDDLPKYDEMKDSGVLWLGDIPAHWTLSRAKNIFIKQNRPVRDEDEVITCFRDGQVTLRKNRQTSGFTISLKEMRYQGIRKGDLVIHIMDAFAGAVGVSDSDGKGSPAYSVCISKQDYSLELAALLMREMANKNWITALATGIRQRSSDFRYLDFAKQIFPIPPLEEQEAIVKYLLYAKKRFTNDIRAKRKLIRLLEEQKKVIVSRFVTKGLDVTASTKQSGVGWLGEIPKHWDVIQLKRIATIVNGSTPKSNVEEYWGNDLVWVTPTDLGSLKTDTISDSRRKLSQLGYISCGTSMVPKGSVILSCRAPIGTLAIADTDLCTNQGCKSIVLNKERCDSWYCYFSLYAGLDELKSYGNGSTFVELSTINLSTFVIPLPPLEEQKHILKHIQQQTSNIENAIKASLKEIELLNELQSRLISDVVTGQVDVRAVSSHLPDIIQTS